MKRIGLLACAILDGTLIPADRVAGPSPSAPPKNGVTA
jgi:hypothetical protein